MTLKEKILDQVQEMPLEVSPTMKDIDNYNLSINNLEKIADEFAIGFGEWLAKWSNVGLKNGNWIINFRLKASTTKEALEIYKKEKGL